MDLEVVKRVVSAEYGERLVEIEVTVRQHGKAIDGIDAEIKAIRGEAVPQWRVKVLEAVVFSALCGAAMLFGLYVKQTLGF